MSKRISELTDSLRQLGELQVNDWDFKALLNRDIRDLEITGSLRKLGNVKVIDWDFKDALPTVHKLAHQEVDLVDLVKRAAQFKVMDWDFRTAAEDEEDPAPPESGTTLPGEEEILALKGRLKNFLQFVVVNLIDEADRAQIKIQEIDPGVLRFKVVVTPKDLTILIGRNGATAAAIRSLLKASAAAEGMHALLQIHSHEEELALRHREAEGG